MSARQRRTAQARTALVAYSALVSLSALGGAVGLVTGGLSIGTDLERRLPWQSPVVGGLALAELVAGPFAAVAMAARRGSRRADDLAVAAGAVLVGWIVVELGFVRAFSALQPVFAAIGLAFVVAGRRGRSGLAAHHPDRPAARRRPPPPRRTATGW